MFDPNRYHKKRKKWGKIVQSDKDKLEDMLSYHQESVHKYLLEKKSEYEERRRQLNLANNYQQGGLRSPPLPSGSGPRSPGLSDARQGSVPNSRKSPKLPPVGFFTVAANGPGSKLGTGSPSPKSPLRGDFRRV
jgi:histone deacetylase 6